MTAESVEPKAGDCALCGLPPHRHSGGYPNTCPIIATYRPRRASTQEPATGELQRLRVYHDAVEQMVCVWAGTDRPSSMDENAWENPEPDDDRWEAFAAARKAAALRTPASPFPREEVAKVAEDAFKAGLQYASDEGWAYLPDALEQSVLAGNAVEALLQRSGDR